MDEQTPRAPFPWFGGKRRVAEIVWKAFDPNVPNYIETHFGSGAVLLGRPGGPGKIETVNDIDAFVTNFWRAVIAEPYEVACWADGPVNEADLHARHKWLVNQTDFREQMRADPEYYSPQIAGWWCWGICQWIGGGWCVVPEERRGGALRGRPRPNLNTGQGVHAPSARHKRPHLLSNKGVHGKARNLEADSRPHLSSDQGVLKQQLPDLAVPARARVTGRGVLRPPEKMPAIAVKADGACAGKGIHSEAALAAYSPGRRPDISQPGKGVHLPSIGNDRGIHGVRLAPAGTLEATFAELRRPDGPPCYGWFEALMQRMARVRVVCGDWKRVLGDSVLGKGKNVGGRRPCAVFLDPPYPTENRDPYLYSHDDGQMFYAVRDWALEHGDDPDLRIAVCGYADDFKWPAGWVEHAWRAGRGYAKKSNKNRERERIWFSPHCLPLEDVAAQQLLW